jgi:hypothetical protein
VAQVARDSSVYADHVSRLVRNHRAELQERDAREAILRGRVADLQRELGRENECFLDPFRQIKCPPRWVGDVAKVGLGLAVGWKAHSILTDED